MLTADEPVAAYPPGSHGVARLSEAGAKGPLIKKKTDADLVK
jgi:hypothetical protein